MYLDSLNEVQQLAKELNAVDQQIRYYNSHAYSGQMWISWSESSPKISIPITGPESLMIQLLKEKENSIKEKLHGYGVKTTRYPDVL